MYIHTYKYIVIKEEVINLGGSGEDVRNWSGGNINPVLMHNSQKTKLKEKKMKVIAIQ